MPLLERELRRRSKIKAGFYPQLTREHRLAPGIVVAIPYAEGAGLYINDVSGCCPAGMGGVTVDSTAWKAQTPAHTKGMRGALLAGAAMFPAHERFAMHQEYSFSVYHLGSMSISGPANAWTQGATDGGNGSNGEFPNAPYWVLEFNIGQWQLDINDGLSGEQNFDAGSISPGTNNLVGLLAVRDVGRGEIRFYLNGLLVATYTDTTSTSSWTTSGGRLAGAIFGIPITYPGRRFLDVIWNGRAITDGEALELHEDPLALFMPVRRMWAMAGPFTLEAGLQRLIISAPNVFQPETLAAGDQVLEISAPSAGLGLHPGAAILKGVAVDPIVVTPFTDLFDVQRLADYLLVDSFDIAAPPLYGATVEDRFDVRPEPVADVVDHFDVIPSGLEDITFGEIQRPTGQAVHA